MSCDCFPEQLNPDHTVGSLALPFAQPLSPGETCSLMLGFPWTAVCSNLSRKSEFSGGKTAGQREELLRPLPRKQKIVLTVLSRHGTTGSVAEPSSHHLCKKAPCPVKSCLQPCLTSPVGPAAGRKPLLIQCKI